MDSNNFTDREMLIQWLDEHWTDVLKYFGAKMKNATEVETMAYDEDKVIGMLCSFVYEGVRKVVNVTPMSLVEGLTHLSEDLARRCEDAAIHAEQQGEYAERQADRVSDAYLDITEQKELAQRMAEYAEEQADRIEYLRGEVTEWFGETPGAGVRKTVSDWLSGTQQAWNSWWDGIKDDWSGWFLAKKAEWNSWFSATNDDWTAWYTGIVGEVSGWFSGAVQEWNAWFAARKNDWTAWFGDTTAAWDAWFAARRSEWTSWFAATSAAWNEWSAAVVQVFSGWEAKEQERQNAEAVRLEMQAHPPIPSVRGYWMFWDVTAHEYVESGYSSRGTMDWPEFFWDYDTMGIGVITDRDYTKFLIDEEGRFCMDM